MSLCAWNRCSGVRSCSVRLQSSAKTSALDHVAKIEGSGPNCCFRKRRGCAAHRHLGDCSLSWTSLDRWSAQRACSVALFGHDLIMLALVRQAPSRATVCGRNAARASRLQRRDCSRRTGLTHSTCMVKLTVRRLSTMTQAVAAPEKAASTEMASNLSLARLQNTLQLMDELNIAKQVKFKVCRSCECCQAGRLGEPAHP
jgi:hypothetical protein